MGARGIGVLIMGLNGLWAPTVEAVEQHAQLQVSASVVVTGTVDARLIERLRSAHSSSDSCAAISLSATSPLPTRISYHMPGIVQMYRQISLCPSAVVAMAQSYGGHAPVWGASGGAMDQSFSVVVEY